MRTPPHERKRLGATKVVIAGVGRATSTERNFLRAHQLSFVLSEVGSLLILRHGTIGVGRVPVLRSQQIRHLLDLLVLLLSDTRDMKTSVKATGILTRRSPLSLD